MSDSSRFTREQILKYWEHSIIPSDKTERSRYKIVTSGKNNMENKYQEAIVCL